MAKSKGKNKVADYPSTMDTAWQARDDLSTLLRAKEIRADKKRMRAAKAEANKQLAALKGAAD